LEIQRTRQKSVSSQSGVVGVIIAKEGSETLGVCVAVIFNGDATQKVWTAVRKTIYSSVARQPRRFRCI
jgi:hypothetical protein